MKLKRLFLLNLLFLITSCTLTLKTPVSHVVSGSFINDEYVLPLNTTITLKMYDKKEMNEVKDNFDNIVNSLNKDVDRYHDYPNYNNLKSINDSCGNNKKIEVSKELIELLKEGVELTKQTNGYFNIFMGNIIDYYKTFLNSENAIVDDNKINELIKNIPSYEIIDDILIIDEATSSVTLNKYNGNNVIISLGAIAKGFVIQKSIDYLKEYNYSLMVDAGSSTIATLKQNPSNENKNWNVGILAPLFNESELLCKFSYFNDGYISTSSYANQYYFYNDKLYHHIINPKTGYSNNKISSITLFSKDASLSILDALSTGLYNMDDKEIISTIMTFNKLYNTNIEFLLVKPHINGAIIEYREFDVIISKEFNNLIVNEFNKKVKSVKIL